MSLFRVLLLGLLAQNPTPAQNRPASIEGFIFKSGTGEPISKANVTLSATSGSARSSVVTAADGRFAFSNVAPGSYSISVLRNGYIDGAFGKRGPNGSGSVLPLAAGQALKDVRISMTAMATISGRVLDSDGEPLANVEVQAFKYSYAERQRVLTMVKVVGTNDRGEYRLFWLPPGQYFVRAVPAPRGLIRIGPDATGHDIPGGGDFGLPDHDAPVYFPGTVDVKTAAAIDLRSGADYNGVDVTVLHEKGHVLRGMVIGGDGKPAGNRSVALRPRDNSRVSTSVNMPVYSNGSFLITGVLPGSYVLAATSHVQNERPTGGRILVEVGSSDLDGLTVPLSPSVDIEGDVLIEGLPTVGGTENHPVITLETPNPQGVLSAVESAQFSDNKSFRMPAVLEGDYQVRFFQLHPPQYVKSIRSNAIDVSNGLLHVDSRSSPIVLDVVIGANGGSIDGVVVDDKRSPLADIKVTLIPDATQRQREDLYKDATTNDSGRFQMQGIAPGTYTLLAWEDIEDGAWLDPDFLGRFEGRGTRIRVDEGSKVNIEILPISATN